MVLVRKALVHFLAAVLLLTLLGAVAATSIAMTLSHPDKLETWLTQSNLYANFVSTAIKQAESSTTGSAQPGSAVSLSDAAVQQAAESAFSPALLQQSVSAFLNGNYAWLEGKTATPKFTIDLTGAKQTFAGQVGTDVRTYLSSLPVCTTTQLTAQTTNDPLSLTCRPKNLDPVAVSSQVTAQLTSNSNFLGKTVITPQSINPNGNAGTRPYYQQLSFAPTAYQLVVKLPWILGGIAVLCTIGILCIALSRRKGLRRIGFVLLEAGIILILLKFITDALVSQVETKAFNHTSNGPLQHSLTSFAQVVETHLVRINLYFGSAFVLLAIIIFMFLLLTRSKSAKPTTSDSIASATAAQTTPQLSDTAAPKTAETRTTGFAQRPQSQPAKPKRPRLIQ